MRSGGRGNKNSNDNKKRRRKPKVQVDKVIFMVLILDGNSDHFTRAYRKICLFG